MAVRAGHFNKASGKTPKAQERAPEMPVKAAPLPYKLMTVSEAKSKGLKVLETRNGGPITHMEKAAEGVYRFTLKNGTVQIGPETTLVRAAYKR